MMKSFFEVKYLDVDWFSKDVVISIKESFDSCKLEFDHDQSCFSCNTIIYPEAEGFKHGRLAFRYVKPCTEAPYFLKPDGARAPLKEIIDNSSGKKWWIEADIWCESKKYWGGGKIFNTPGTANIVLGDQKCLISIGVSHFTSAQLQLYLSDFKNDLWELLLDEDSYVSRNINSPNNGGVSEESLKSIAKLLSHAQNIALSPKSELREVQAIKPRRMVKPVNRTFMELSTKGGAKHLTSRATEPSFNVPENRYVLFALIRTNILLKGLVAASKNKLNRFEGKMSKLDERLLGFSDFKTISKDLVRKDLENIKKTYNKDNLNMRLDQKLKANRSLLSEKVTGRTLYIKVKRYNKKRDGYHVEVKHTPEGMWSNSKKLGKTIYLNFRNAEYSEIFEIDFEYKIHGDISFQQGSNGGDYERHTLISLNSVSIIGGEAITLRQERFTIELGKALNLQRNDWKKSLSSKELTEQEKEKNSVKIQLKYFKEDQLNVQRVYSVLEPKLAKFDKVISQLKNLGVKPLSTFPNSMTFVQNPDYQAVHSGYIKIRETANLTDESLLLTLEEVDQIGLINMPLLYERWCFLQIIKVLIQNFNYKPTHDWKKRLMSIVLTERQKKGKANFLDFDHAELNRKIKLRYEPKLDNGRYPDFVLDVKFERKDGSKHTKRFIMDAKYYSDKYLRKKGGIAGVIEELFCPQNFSDEGKTYKNYSEDGKNSVFIIHPVVGAVEPAVSPQAWGLNSYLGELAMFDWDNGSMEQCHDDTREQEKFFGGAGKRSQFHQYGAICANPISRLNYLDEFQRMIGLFLQYNIEDNTSFRESDDAEATNFCIACGSHDLIRKDNNSKKSSWYECNNCSHFTTYNHCNSCKVRLIKNGDYWSYHSQMPMEPLNIKCPACESLL